MRYLAASDAWLSDLRVESRTWSVEAITMFSPRSPEALAGDPPALPRGGNRGGGGHDRNPTRGRRQAAAGPQDIDMQGVVTRRDLQSGVAWAIGARR